MRAPRSQMRDHATSVSNVLCRVCEFVPAIPVVRFRESSPTWSDLFELQVVAASPAGARSIREVTTDLGRQELVVPLPVPSVEEPRFWVGLHESWRAAGSRFVRFESCGLRLYVGEGEAETSQVVRLEWVAAREEDPPYEGGHAGHPHWHIDRSALVGKDEAERSLEILTRPEGDRSTLEEFDSNSSLGSDQSPRLVYDCSWLPSVHLPAQANWMTTSWDGTSSPAPQQSTPQDLAALAKWWTGALLYLAAELRTHAS